MWKFISNEPNEMNPGVKQHRYTMTIPKIIRGVQPNIKPSILFIGRCKKVDYRDKAFDDFGLMILY